jgi:Ca-activated chloride channel family protein
MVKNSRSSQTRCSAIGAAVLLGACLLCRLGGGGCLLAADPPAGENRLLDDQGPAVLERSIIRVSTNLVTLPVSVMDPGGCEVPNLEIQDFLIREDGRDEPVFRVAPSDKSPLRLVLLFDLSGSLNERFGFEQWAATRFLEKSWRPGDAVSIIAFNDRPRVLLQMSNSLSEAIKVLSGLEPTDSPTAFLDAVAVSAGILRQSANPETRQAVIALTDGEDNRSRRGLDAALRAIQRADAIFYSINPGGNSIRLNEISLLGQAALASLAQETGGNAFVSGDAGELDAVFERISADLRAQYLLSYYSTNAKADGNYRRISVTVPSRPDLRIRTRLGYYAAPK